MWANQSNKEIKGKKYLKMRDERREIMEGPLATRMKELDR
jgi:hypothetical protein